jgi:uncharacterized membrane protein YagU involved in acid resistance
VFLTRSQRFGVLVWVLWFVVNVVFIATTATGPGLDVWTLPAAAATWIILAAFVWAWSRRPPRRVAAPS